MRSARVASASTATARHVGWLRIHSMPTEPAPAPTSHSSSPGLGASRASAEARRSRLVSWPSCSYASSGSPAVQPSPGPSTSTATTFSRGESACHPLAEPDARLSFEPPRSPSTVSRLAPAPCSVSRRAMVAGVVSSAESTSSRRPGATSRSTRWGSRPTSETTATDSGGPPHPCPGQRDRRHGRLDGDTVGSQQADQGAADPGDQRVAGGQHGHLAAVVLLQQRRQPVRERAGPRHPLLPLDRRHQAEVPLSSPAARERSAPVAGCAPTGPPTRRRPPPPRPGGTVPGCS